MSDFPVRTKKRVALTVLDHKEPAWMPDGKMPATRAECPDTSKVMCRAVRCKWHLLRIDGGVDGTRAGRPGASKIPRGVHGWTESKAGDLGSDERAGTTLMPLWLDQHGELRHVPTCAIDEIAKHSSLSYAEVGERVGRHRTLIAREVRRAISELADRGVTLDDLQRLTDPHHALNGNREPSRVITGRRGGSRT